jgi:hypothetical protein
MRVAYLECFSGISGDMFLGALVDAGISPRLLEETVAALGLGARLEISRVLRSGLSATKVDVWVDGEKDLPRDAVVRERIRRIEEKALRKLRNPRTEKELERHAHEPVLHHDHEHSSGAGISRAGVPAPHEHSHGRGIAEIRTIIGKAAISNTSKTTAVTIFEALGAA